MPAITLVPWCQASQKAPGKQSTWAALLPTSLLLSPRGKWTNGQLAYMYSPCIWYETSSFSCLAQHLKRTRLDVSAKEMQVLDQKCGACRADYLHKALRPGLHWRSHKTIVMDVRSSKRLQILITSPDETRWKKLVQNQSCRVLHQFTSAGKVALILAFFTPWLWEQQCIKTSCFCIPLKLLFQPKKKRF